MHIHFSKSLVGEDIFHLTKTLNVCSRAIAVPVISACIFDLFL